MTDTRGGIIRALDPVATGVMGLAGAALVGMALVQFWQVFARYVLNDSPGWTEPVALLMMSFAVMFGAAVAVRRESHFAFQSFQHALSEKAQWGLKTFSRLIAAASGVGLMVLGGALMIDEWPVAMAGAPLPSGMKFAALCVGGALILLFSVERLVTGDYVGAPEEEEI